MIDEPPLSAPKKPAVWLLLLSLFLSLPILIVGLWISLAWSEQVFHFLARFRPKLDDTAWHFAIFSRVIAWLILAFSVIQLTTALRIVLGVIWRSDARARRWLITLWMQMICLLVLISTWTVLMLPSVVLMEGMRRPTSEPPPPPPFSSAISA